MVAAAGQPVKKGDLLLTMESMKMENQVTSEYEGTIKSVLVQPGQNVMQDDKLVEIETVAVAAAPAAFPYPVHLTLWFCITDPMIKKKGTTSCPFSPGFKSGMIKYRS